MIMRSLNLLTREIEEGFILKYKFAFLNNFYKY